MMKTRISKSYRADKHVGWKKTVGGREWQLCHGTTAGAEAKAIAIAAALEAKWALVKASGGDELTKTDLDDVLDLIEWRGSRPAIISSSTPAVNQVAPRIRIANFGAATDNFCLNQPSHLIRRFVEYSRSRENVKNIKDTAMPPCRTKKWAKSPRITTVA